MFQPARTRATSQRAVLSNRASSPRAPTSCTPIGNPFAPVISGNVTAGNSSQVTDGAVCVFLASRAYAEKYAAKRGLTIEQIPTIKGWGHNTARLRFADKVAESKDSEYVLPHVRSTITSASAKPCSMSP